ncbi:hypothetical protein SMACR_00740 [Sordaria macrospora]|uniref:WGS project CABT00000000 data, contig 2.2 n=2 Tax=Sordaria macrospora TaxID=5147 RepID=F7VMY4_SORMK|nr:uncharacterized protein SMAC_00740 [Sordaria macrospora k-hell]KAA8635692.1 hypothetical protein SMACR_00740 [Sordaria macrospora]KAH7630117.1 hypothetical protein B0T09DRAFT_383680 [Sordaria sp. MPI-SDFR-AT-0083]WPJ66797.1 hypothetical protein SMAC4_00740 [Sordaria macrospora]CCC06713.1 unnamed protein product [Sordaria macrospora k-hell]
MPVQSKPITTCQDTRASKAEHRRANQAEQKSNVVVQEVEVEVESDMSPTERARLEIMAKVALALLEMMEGQKKGGATKEKET